MKHVLIIGLCFVSVFCELNNRPIIGILTQPSGREIVKHGEQFLAASYVKFIESAGARVVPIKYSITADELSTLLSSINGVLLPGGGVNYGTQHEYWETLTDIMNFVKYSNFKNDYFPIWGTCMGFQEISLQISGNMDLLKPYDSENYTVPLNFTSAVKSSRIFAKASSDVMTTLATLPVTMNNHHWGVDPKDFAGNENLTNFFNVLSTNVDRVGKTFISTMEGKNMPVYASQWHPEKVSFEWDAFEVINHSTESVIANQYPATFFVSECRKSTHKFSSLAEETQALIYNFKPVFMYAEENDFELGYFFDA